MVRFPQFGFVTIILVLSGCSILEIKAKDNVRFLAISTWNFGNATQKAFETLKTGMTAIDAIERGCTVCEELQCDGTVGFGGSPAENGETALDAMIMDGKTANVGAVANLRRIKPAISVARKVLENTQHSFLVGDLATEFAIQMGFKEETLETEASKDKWLKWKENNCQPNFWINVTPEPTTSCGPYKPNPISSKDQGPTGFGSSGNHDTIGMIALDSDGNIASGTSTNGANFKIPGRVGDSALPGSGSYADNEVGAAAATGDGDVMLRFLPSFLAVESMRLGLSPSLAAENAMKRIAQKYPSFIGGIVVVNMDGVFGAACHGIDSFPFTVATQDSGKVETMSVKCIED